MPAGPPAPPRAVPARKIGGRGLPQDEVHGVALVWRDLNARAGDHLIERAAGEAAIAVHAGHVEEHVPLGHIGAAAGKKLLDDGDHLRNRFGGARLESRLKDAKNGNIVMKLVQRPFGELADRNILFGSASIYLVVHIGDVANIGDVLGAVDQPQQTKQNVEDDHGPRIADVSKVVDGRSAHIEAHVLRVGGGEDLLGAAQRVVKLQFHFIPALPARGSLHLDLLR